MTTIDTEDHDARVHRALSSPVRARMIELLRADDAALGVERLADHLDLHVNTVRAHLGVLEDAGLVSSEPEVRTRPGRPRLVYRATEQAEVRTEDRGYRFLAEVLASYLAATADDPSDAGRAAGAAWGQYLVDRPAPFDAITDEQALERVVAMLDDFGFVPELDDSTPARPRVLLHRCPFLDVAKEQQAVVCSIHLGLMRGALDELGVDVTATDLLPFVEPNLCVAELEVPS